MNETRRRILAAAGLTPLLLISAGPSRAAEGSACYDPDALTLSQKSRRRSLNYVESSNDPARRCGACSFFTASSLGCGGCAMLGGGPVNATAVCSSFAPKASK